MLPDLRSCSMLNSQPPHLLLISSSQALPEPYRSCYPLSKEVALLLCYHLSWNILLVQESRLNGFTYSRTMLLQLFENCISSFWGCAHPAFLSLTPVLLILANTELAQTTVASKTTWAWHAESGGSKLQSTLKLWTGMKVYGDFSEIITRF